jgi:plastocyanin
VELAGPPPHFVPAQLEASAGDVSFFLKNSSQGFHTMSIGPALRDSLVTSTTIEPGRSAIFSVKGLRPGPYIIWCTISDHAALGMVGTLTVK